VVYSPFAWRFDTIAKLLQGDSTAFEESGRGMAYMGALRMTLDHPIVGVGLGHDYPFLVQYTGMGNMYIHSDLLGLGGIVGLPGLVLFYCIPILMLRRLNWIRKHPLLMPGELNSVLFFRVFLVCYLFRTIGSSVYENRIHWVLLGWILGYAYNKCIELRRREEYAPVLYESPIPDRAETTSISAPVLAPRQT